MAGQTNWVVASTVALPRVRGWLEAVFLLSLRVYLADIFLRAGLLKLQSWETTLALFEYEYAVPVLSSTTAAWLGTTGEILLPALLVVGLMGRFSAAGLFALNAVAAVSYPEISSAGFKDHLLWGWMCLPLIIFGCGRLSVDDYLLKRWQRFIYFGSIEPSPWQPAMATRERF